MVTLFHALSASNSSFWNHPCNWDRQPLFLLCQLVFLVAVPMKGTGKRPDTCGKKDLLLLGASYLLSVPVGNTHRHVFTVAFYSSLYSPTNSYHSTLRASIPINCQRSAFQTHSTYLWSQRHQYQHSFSKVWISTTREPSPKPLNIKKLELFLLFSQT